MIFWAYERAATSDPVQQLRSHFADAVHRRCLAGPFVFVGLVLWDVAPFGEYHAAEIFEHRIEVDLEPAGTRKPTSRETIGRLMSEADFRACARTVRSL